MNILLLIVSVFMVVEGGPRLINEQVDQVLRNVSGNLKSSGFDVVEIPRVNDQWKYDGRLLSLSGDVVCWDGWIKPISTIKRKGDAISVKMNNVTFIRLELGLERIEFGFGKCAVTHFLTFARPVSGSVDQNSIKWVVSLQGNPCQAKTEEIALLKLEGINLNAQTFLGQGENKIIQYLGGFFKKTILESLNRKLKELSSYVIQNFNFCNFAKNQ